jgi:hypothetical protein
MARHRSLLLLIACFVRLTSLAQGGYFQQEADYTIDVTLHDPQHTLDGAISIRYHNNSSDTLTYIWIHCWPNAFRNDRTAFSEQLLGNGRTDFYFSDKQQRGYINRLAFKVDGLDAEMQDHPQYIDIIKVILPRPLPPGGMATLTTPFHVQLPYNFSGNGYVRSSYQITHWYPEPAVYDAHGWHPMPYLGDDTYYSEFGSYDVHITVPPGFKVAASAELKDSTGRTFHYNRDHIDGFAWYADRHFHFDHDTVRLPSGRVIDVYAYYTTKGWKNGIDSIKHAIRFGSALFGEYPYETATVIQTVGNSTDDQIDNCWFPGSNTRRYPWLSAGLKTYYENRYRPKNENLAALYTSAVEKKDPPISTSSEDFTAANYHNIAHTKAAIWLKMLEDSLGTPLFDSCMQAYFRQWRFKHPYPDDFKAIIENVSHKNLDGFFALLDAKGSLPPMPAHRRIKPVFGWNLNHTDSIQYLGIAPALGYNEYDHILVGAVIHNFNLPPAPVQFFLAPLYGTVSHRLEGVGGLFWTVYPDHGLQKIRLGIGGSRFSTTSAVDSNGHNIYGGFYKVTPSLRIVFPRSDPRSTRELALEWKTFLIGENMLDDYVRKTADSMYYPTAGKYGFRYLNQLSFDICDKRALYPYNASLRFQQASNFYRLDFTGNYFFNYAKGGGLDLRVFGAKFGYLASGSSSAGISRYEPKLTAVRGDEDYTYSNYFIGRSEFIGLASQQIMERDGNVHLRTDLFQGLQGRSDNWVASLNLRTTLPRQIVPEWLPLKLFFDAGTYAEAWTDNPPTSHFLYAGGFELDLLHDVLRIYAPLVYSSDFSNQLKTVPDQNSFWKKISFSIDLGNIDLHKIIAGK